jgi:hypothetical protein
MITFDDHATSRTSGNQAGRRETVEVCIEGVQRANGALRLGIVVSGRDCRRRHYG